MKELVEKLVSVSQEIGFLEFDKSNSGQGYKYVSAASVIRKLNLALASRGLLAFVSHETVEVAPWENTKGSKMIHAVVSCGITITDGAASVTFHGSGSGADTGDKAVMKASTAAYKYAIAHGLTLGWDAADPEDDRHDASGAQAQPKGKLKGKKPSPLKALLASIEAASSPIELEALKPSVLELDPQSQDYAAAKAAFIKRKSALS